MKISFTQFGSLVPYLYKARFPIQLRARHGVGKSTTVLDMARDLGLPVVERRASQMSEGDLLGLPARTKLVPIYVEGVLVYREFESDEITRFTPMDWLYIASRQGVILFLDEVDRASLEVRQGLMELADSRKLHGVYLHPDTIMVAATNSGEDESFAAYSTNVMDEAELDRWTTFDLKLTKSEWVVWARRSKKVHPLIIRFMNEASLTDANKGVDYPLMVREDSLGEFPNRVDPSPRSWHRLSEEISDLLDQIQVCPNKAERNELLQIVRLLTLGKVGGDCAGQFSSFLHSMKDTITHEDVLAGRVPPELLKTLEATTQIQIGKMLAEAMEGRLGRDELSYIMEFFNEASTEVSAIMYNQMRVGPERGAESYPFWKTNMRNLSCTPKIDYDDETEYDMMFRDGTPATAQARILEVNSFEGMELE